MLADIPYMKSNKNVTAIIEKMKQAAQPATFTLDFLKDLGFPSSNDRGIIKVLKYIGFIDQNSKPLEPYRRFLDHTQSKHVMAEQLRIAYDDLFNANKNADKMSSNDLKGWFRSKTGNSDAVAEKIASTFKSLSDLADFSQEKPTHKEKETEARKETPEPVLVNSNKSTTESSSAPIGLVYRFEIHLPDTQNIDTYRAIFKALKEELLR